MSYRNRKKNKSFVGRMKYLFGLAKIVLLQLIKWTERRRKAMRLRQTSAITAFLREKARIVRSNNLRINEWVDDYINRCILEGKPVEILTQMCISKDLEMRYREQGNAFVPTKKERLLFARELPQIVSVFRDNGVSCNWWLTFNQSYLDSGRIGDELRLAYTKMIADLARPLTEEGWLVLADWERDILEARPRPSDEVLSDIGLFVKPEALEIEIQRHSLWARESAGLNQSVAELKRDALFQIACEAEEGRYLANDPAFENCLLVPLETPERYDFFTLLAPDLKKRVVAVLPPYPWRLKEQS